MDIKRFIGGLAYRSGYVLSPIWRLRDEEMGRHLRSVFRRLGIDCVFDVGANLGQFARFLRTEVGFKGLIVSVEPIVAHAEALRSASANDALWQVAGVALGASPGRLDINVAKSGDLSSFLQPRGDDNTGLADRSKVVAVESVEVCTFDDLLTSVREQYTARNVYLKLDTQGFDLEVLRGIGDVTSVAALQSEMSVVPIYEGMPDYITALRAFAERGFTPTAMFPVNHAPDGRLIEFDCVMVGGFREPCPP